MCGTARIRYRGGVYHDLLTFSQAAYQSLAYPSTETAWPHTKYQHNLQLGTGIAPGNPKSDALAYKAMAEGPYQIRPGHTAGDYFPNFIEEFVDVKKVEVLCCYSFKEWCLVC